MIDFLEFLALCLLQFPILIGMGLSMECGMGSGCDCSVACSVCSGSTPDEFEVTVPGISDLVTKTCTGNCSDVDGLYVLTRDTPALLNTGCTWSAPTLDCYERVYFWLVASGGLVGRQVRVYTTVQGPTSPDIIWLQNVVGSQVDCTAYSSTATPYSSTGADSECNGTTTNALVTSS